MQQDPALDWLKGQKWTTHKEIYKEGTLGVRQDTMDEIPVHHRAQFTHLFTPSINLAQPVLLLACVGKRKPEVLSAADRLELDYSGSVLTGVYWAAPFPKTKEPETKEMYKCVYPEFKLGQGPPELSQQPAGAELPLLQYL